jgi:hypothetical protein
MARTTVSTPIRSENPESEFRVLAFHSSYRSPTRPASWATIRARADLMTIWACDHHRDKPKVNH